MKKVGKVISTHKPFLGEIRQAVPVPQYDEDVLKLYKDAAAKIDALSKKYEQFSNTYELELRTLFMQLRETNGVDKLMKIAYGFFLLASFIFLFLRHL